MSAAVSQAEQELQRDTARDANQRHKALEGMALVSDNITHLLDDELDTLAFRLETEIMERNLQIPGFREPF